MRTRFRKYRAINPKTWQYTTLTVEGGILAAKAIARDYKLVLDVTSGEDVPMRMLYSDFEYWQWQWQKKEEPANADL